MYQLTFPFSRLCEWTFSEITNISEIYFFLMRRDWLKPHLLIKILTAVWYTEVCAGKVSGLLNCLRVSTQ